MLTVHRRGRPFPCANSQTIPSAAGFFSNLDALPARFHTRYPSTAYIARPPWTTRAVISSFYASKTGQPLAASHESAVRNVRSKNQDIAVSFIVPSPSVAAVLKGRSRQSVTISTLPASCQDCFNITNPVKLNLTPPLDLANFVSRT